MEETTTMLTYHLLKSAGLNIGLETLEKSLLAIANDTYSMPELSSFHLTESWITNHIAIITI
jgi:UDP-N-acetylmuramoylalanine-D-glutamate ligase